MSDQFEPVIVGFLCNWCSYRAADLAGTARIKYAPNMRPIRVMCSGRVDPQFVLTALLKGADGVLIAGWTQWGIEDERVQLLWASASEGIFLAERVNKMTEEIRALGPLRWYDKVLGGNGAEPVTVKEA